MTNDEIKTDIAAGLATEAAAERSADTAVLEAMAKAGLLFGRKRTVTNPRMRKYIYANRNGIEIFDLTRTIDCLEIAGNFLKEVAKSGRTILFVGTNPAGQEAVRETAAKFDAPFVVERWLGGTLTNFDSLSTRLKYFMNLKADQAAGRLDKYTKKERSVIDKQLSRLERLFGGLEKLQALPGAVVVAGADDHAIVIAEANRMKIPVVVIANTSANPDPINYIIPANDNSRSSVAWIMEKLSEAIADGKRAKSASAEIAEAKK